jgi:hypothetical protein
MALETRLIGTVERSGSDSGRFRTEGIHSIVVDGVATRHDERNQEEPKAKKLPHQNAAWN